MKLLFQPVRPFYIYQKFGENKACVTLDGTNKVISCDGHNPPEGYRSLYGELGHTGLDLMAKHGQEVYCAQDGVVYWIDTHPKSGLDVRVESNVNGVKFRHIYEHLMGYQPKIGDTVKTGQLIGWADNTGYSSGDHLHFQLEIWNGTDWIKSDPLLYMEDTFALTIRLQTDVIGYLKELLAKLLDNKASNLRK